MLQSNSQSTLPNPSPQPGIKSHLPMPQFCSPPQQQPKECRICLQTEQQSFPLPLITVCKCTGSVSFLHEECIRKWIDRSYQGEMRKLRSGRIQCQLCKYFIRYEVLGRDQCYGWREIVDEIRTKVVLFLMVLLLMIVSVMGITFSLYILWQQSQLLKKQNGLYFVLILSICGALFALLFLAIALYLLITSFFIKKSVVVGQIKQYQSKKPQRNQIVPMPVSVNGPQQSIDQINYVQ